MPMKKKEDINIENEEITEKPGTRITIQYRQCGHKIETVRGGKFPIKCPECG